MDQTSVFMPIVKAEKASDGTLFVTGKATGPDLDLDHQVCDPAWLAKAMPAWFESGANVREMHQPIAAGVGQMLEQDADSWLLRSLVVDPGSVAKVDAKVLTGYSIGIRSPKVVKDAAAPGGRIVGGQIIEVSLVDRPANPTCTLMLAKALTADEPVLVEADVAKDANAVEPDAPVDDQEAEEVDLLAVAREAIAALLAGEAAEVQDGTGGTGPVEILASILDQLDYYASCDAMDDALSMAAAVKATLNKENTVDLASIADLVKVATADDATDDQKAPVSELRKALGIEDLDEKLTELTDIQTKAATAEDLEEVAARLAKVEAMPAPGGPVRMAPISVADQAKADRLSKAAGYRQLSRTIVDQDMAAEYARMAADLEIA